MATIITVRRNGSYKVEGDDVRVVDWNGNEYTVSRLPIALCRLYGPAPLRLLAIGYVEFFRGIPILLLLYFIYYGLPGLAMEFWAIRT